MEQLTQEKNLKSAKTMFESVCRVVDAIGWSYDKDEANLSIDTTIRGDDLTLHLSVMVDVRSQVVILESKLPFNIQKEYYDEVARAINYVNKRIIDGAFNFSCKYGAVYFRATECFKESLISDDVLKDLIRDSLNEVDRYNDYLFYLGAGIKTLEDFVAFADTLSYPAKEIDERVSKRGKEVFDTICEVMEDHGWKYYKDEQKLNIGISFDTEDYDIGLHFFIDLDTQKITLLSMLPFEMQEGARDKCAIAACEVNYRLKDGDFLCDFANNRIFFKLTTSFKGSLLSKSLLDEFLDLAYAIVDIYNDKFAALNSGEMSLQDFVDFIDGK